MLSAFLLLLPRLQLCSTWLAISAHAFLRGWQQGRKARRQGQPAPAGRPNARPPARAAAVEELRLERPIPWLYIRGVSMVAVTGLVAALTM